MESGSWDMLKLKYRYCVNTVPIVEAKSKKQNWPKLTIVHHPVATDSSLLGLPTYSRISIYVYAVPYKLWDNRRDSSLRAEN